MVRARVNLAPTKNTNVSFFLETVCSVYTNEDRRNVIRFRRTGLENFDVYKSLSLEATGRNTLFTSGVLVKIHESIPYFPKINFTNSIYYPLPLISSLYSPHQYKVDTLPSIPLLKSYPPSRINYDQHALFTLVTVFDFTNRLMIFKLHFIYNTSTSNLVNRNLSFQLIKMLNELLVGFP